MKDQSEIRFASPDNSLLSRETQAVTINELKSADVQGIIDNMLNVAHGEQGNPERPTMVGLAAPQLGIDKRIIIVGIDADGTGGEPEFEAYINPEIVFFSKDKNDNREGCYSTSRVAGVVERSSTVEIQALNRFGQSIHETFTGFVARIFQHEIDHLNGIRFPDRITDDNKLFWVEDEEFGSFRENWQNWPNKCPRSKWESIKQSL